MVGSLEIVVSQTTGSAAERKPDRDD